MRRSCSALLAAALLSSSAPADAYLISAQTQYLTGGASEGSDTEEAVSAIDFRVFEGGNTMDLSSQVSGASGVLNARARMDSVVNGSSGTGKASALLREDVVLHPDPGATEVVVRGSLQVVTNSSAVFYPAGPQGYARQGVRLTIVFEDSNPSLLDIAAYGHTVQNNPGLPWSDGSSASPPEFATAVGAIETGTVNLELRIPVARISAGEVLSVVAVINAEATAGNHAMSYAESGLETQLTLDVEGGTHDATFPFFLAPEPDGALLGCVALAALAARRQARGRVWPGPGIRVGAKPHSSIG
jgi:hypothetical protein